MKKLLFLLLSSVSCFGATSYPPTSGSSGITNGTTNATFAVPFILQQGGTNLFTVGTNTVTGNQESTVRIPTTSGKVIPAAAQSQFTPNTDWRQRTWANSFLGFINGDVSGASSLPTRGPELWRRAAKPPVYFTTWFLTQPRNVSQNFVTNAIRVLNTNVVPWLAKNGDYPFIEIEGWTYTNANKLLNRQFNGNVWWDTNRFADGMPFITAYGQTNGVRIMVQQYYDNVANGTSSNENKDNAGNGCISYPNTVRMDVYQIASWGVYSILVADTSEAGYYQQMMNLWADAVLQPNDYAIGETNALYSSVRGNPSLTNQMSLGYDMVYPAILPQVPFAANFLVTDQPYYGSGNAAIGSNAMYTARVTYTNLAPFIGKGHFLSGQDVTDGTLNTASLEDMRFAFNMGAMFCAPVQLGYNTNIHATWVQCFTNDDMRTVYFDEACMPAVRVYDLGPSNISCWVKPLSTGAYGVVLCNESGASQTLGLGLNQITSAGSYYPPIGATIPFFNVNSNGVFSVRDIWAQSTLAGTTLTLSNTIAAHTSRMYIVKEVPQFASAAAATYQAFPKIETTNGITIHASTAAGVQVNDRDNEAASSTFFGSGGVAGLYDNAAGYQVSWIHASPFTITLGGGSTSPISIPGQLTVASEINSQQGTGANIAGNNFKVNAGAGTGTGRGGAFMVTTAPSGSSGSSVNAAVTRIYISAKEVVLTETTATLVFNVTLAAGKSLHMRVYGTVRADNSTDFQSEGDTFEVAAVNKAGTVTTALSGTLVSAVAVSSGTLTTTWTAVANGNGVDIKANSTSSLTQTTLNVMGWRAEIDSNDTGLTITPQ